MKIYFATWLTDTHQGKSLTKRKASKRLVSFYFLIEQKVTSEIFDDYVDNGFYELKPKQKPKC
jgi:hypothetical protein